ncbi:uncharacterized protein BJ212DRAFT_1384967 [Suillus subaureus]|uniref:Uncharacterized protein n=1 Tax=Suillus subaureus TaxID=48587 RepID=A0A9P7J8H8_9AGAM|nr:uncharacterized protein BJ212DRAFT_1384967 [Suillus subaureus]KAG1807998.1 hypothetical protein BJ212DRAFT_1384967 [Suillus subaureus]
MGVIYLGGVIRTRTPSHEVSRYTKILLVQLHQARRISQKNENLMHREILDNMLTMPRWSRLSEI